MESLTLSRRTRPMTVPVHMDASTRTAVFTPQATAKWKFNYEEFRQLKSPGVLFVAKSSP